VRVRAAIECFEMAMVYVFSFMCLVYACGMFWRCCCLLSREAACPARLKLRACSYGVQTCMPWSHRVMDLSISRRSVVGG
jgi:hypothetical protein